MNRPWGGGGAGGFRLIARRHVLVLVLAASFAAAAPLLPAAAAKAASCDAFGAFDVLMNPVSGDADPELHACYGKIRPGARMSAPVGCTMNWIVRDTAGALYVGTAGHCVGTGAAVSVDGVGFIGNVVYSRCCLMNGLDYALVKIDPSKYAFVDPTLCHWGGPTDAGRASLGERLLVYGFGSIYGGAAATRGRAGVAYANSPGTLQYVGMMQPGDSGAPVMAEDGTAVGVHVQSSLSVPGTGIRVDPSFKYATRMDDALVAASAALGTTLTLVPSSTPPSLLNTVGP